jgi:hypothetical protein
MTLIGICTQVHPYLLDVPAHDIGSIPTRNPRNQEAPQESGMSHR